MQNWKFMFMKKEMYIFNLELAMHKNWIISLKMEKPSKKKKKSQCPDILRYLTRLLSIECGADWSLDCSIHV